MIQIVSNFNDCYDWHNENIYKDLNIPIYVRNYIDEKPDIVDVDLIQELKDLPNLNNLPTIIYKSKILECHLGWLFVAGYIFPIISTGEDKYNISLYKVVKLNMCQSQHQLDNFRFLSKYCAIPYDNLTSLAISLKMPVFCILSGSDRKSHEYKIVRNRVPILKNTGILNHFDTIKLFSIIEFYVSSVINNGDKNPPIVVSDDIKRDKHGFDKNSFKHRPK